MRTKLIALSIIAFSLQAQSAKKQAPPSGRRVPSFDVRAFGGSMPAGSRVVLSGGKDGDRARYATSGDRAATARQFLIVEGNRLGLSANAAGQMKLLRQSETFSDFQQTIGGVPVFEGNIKVMLSQSGEPISVALPGWTPEWLNRMLTVLTPEDAVRASFKTLHIDAPGDLQVRDGGSAFENPLGPSHDAISVEIVAFPISADSARLAWHVRLDGGKGRRAELVIDATDGRLLFCHSLERAAGSGRVWRIAPDKGDRAQVNFPEGWLSAGQTATNANNADVYLDTDGNDEPDSLTDVGIRNGRAFAENQTFDFPAPDPNGQDDPRKFRAAAVTNAFYFANTAHDYFYGLGFDEAAGNFQRDNGSKGGRGGDPVRVEVQDLDSPDNAYTNVTAEGISPRIELGIYRRGTTAANDDRDIAYDGQTMLHEYTHGVSNRSLGGGASTSCLIGDQSGAIDEGVADYFAASFFNNPIQSSFYAGTPEGLRRRSYEGYPYTYEDLGNDGFEIHRDGEIWAATLWDLRKTLGQNLTDKLVYTALRGGPCRPTFVSARDAILAADEALNSRANRLRIWETFARHGLGASASGVDGFVGSATVFTAAFDLPPDLSTTNNRGPLLTSQPPDVVTGGAPFTYQIRAQDTDGGTVRYELLLGPAGMTVDASGLVRWNAGFLGGRAKILITDGQGGRLIHGFQIEVLTPLRPGIPVTMAIPVRSESAFVSIEVPPATPVLQLTSRGGNGDVDLSLVSPEGRLEFSEPRIDSFETMSMGNPSPGRWIGAIYAYKAFEGAAITATFPAPRLIKGNDSLLGLNGEPSSETFYRVIVPPGANSLSVRTRGGSGDVDVFVDRETPPVCQSFDDTISQLRCYFRGLSINFRNNEDVQISTPQAGNWYINLSSAGGYGAVALTTLMSVRPTLVVDPLAITFNAIEGSPAPAAQVVKLADPSGGKFDWTATANPVAPWLKLTPDKGSGDADLLLSVSTQGLTPGTYRTALTINGVGLGSSPQTVNITFNYTGPASIVPTVQQLTFTAPAGTNPPSQNLEFNNPGGGALEWSITAATESGGNWLSVDQPRGTGNGRIQVIARAGTLAPGTYDGTVTIAAPGAPNAVVRVRYVVTLGMSLSEESLRGAASQLLGRAVSPGDLVVIQGSNLIASCTTAPCPAPSGYPLPTELGGLQIRVNGLAAPLVSVSPTEARFIIPFEASGSEVSIVASRGATSTAPVVRALEPQSIGVFTVLENGLGAAKMFHSDGSLVSRSALLVAGETISIQTGGLGAASSALTGAAASADPLSVIALPVQVYFDGREGTVESAHLEPGAAGLYRVRVVVPMGIERKFPAVQVQSAISQSQEVSAGGISLANLTPAGVAKGADANVTLTGINFPVGAGVKIGEETIAGELADGAIQSLRVTIPARLLESASELVLSVVDPAAPAEAASNPAVLRVR